MSEDHPTPVTVQILEKEYRISCAPEERPGLLESARILDERMRQVRKSGRVLGGDRIAVMAALNLIYELMHERDQQTQVASRLKGLQERVSHAVTGESGTPTA
ncbi:Z ring-associated protein ZapA [Thiorhodovibrio winogradskyi]|uniref:Cell division protein ZapA n=1 Tax=Thiorhodovibrio winogradskyi TaxID=77007 RepID=A0ABZ0S2F4_9GAMM|nr:cell division protein ZapA [Thiorhodovibrio winogradskyi]